MSQAAVTSGTATPKPRHPHFAAREAEVLRQQRSQPEQPGDPKPADPVTPPATQPVTPPPSNPQPTEPQAKPTTDNIPLPDDYQDALTRAMGVTPPPAPNIPPAPKSEELDKYAAQNEQLRKELEETRAALEAARKVPEQLQSFHDEQQLDELLKQEQFNTLDRDDAKRLLMPLLSTMRKQNEDSLKEIQKQLAAQEQNMQKEFQQRAEQERFLMRKATQDKILKAHPDFDEIRKTDVYRRVMNSPVMEGSRVLVGQLVGSELEHGNADYAIKVLNHIKAQVNPDLAQVASVPGSSTAVSPAQPATNSDRLTDEQLIELRLKLQRREISREEFHAAMEKHRKAL